MNQKGKKGSHGGHGGHGVAEDLLPIPVKQMFSVYDPQIAWKTEEKIEKQNTEFRTPTPNPNSEPQTPNPKLRTPNRELQTERRTPNCEQRTTNLRAHRE